MSESKNSREWYNWVIDNHIFDIPANPKKGMFTTSIHCPVCKFKFCKTVSTTNEPLTGIVKEMLFDHLKDSHPELIKEE